MLRIIWGCAQGDKKTNYHASENPNLKRNSDKDSSRGYKSKGSPEGGKPRTIQKDSNRGYKSMGSPEGGKPRTIQKDSSRGYKSRGSPEAGRLRTIQKDSRSPEGDNTEGFKQRL